jgi:hypothetical protein
MPYDDLKKALERLPQAASEEEDEECPLVWTPRNQLIGALHSRTLGTMGQSLLAWLEHGGDLTPEREELLRKVCAKTPAHVWDGKAGFFVTQGNLDPDEIIDDLPQELADDRECEEILAQVDTECSNSYGSGVHLMDKSQLY